MNDCTVIVVNWNTRDDLRECLLSLRDQGEIQSITVVDQGSTDGSVPMVRTEFPGVNVLLQDNEGYGAALNAAAKESGGEYLIFSNADIVVGAGCVQALLTQLRKDPQVGLVGPRVVNPAGKQATRFSRTTLVRTLLLEITPNVFRGALRDVEQKWRTRATPCPVKYVEGAFVAVRRSVFEGIGGFDEGYSFFYEDFDLSLRMRRSGFKVLHVPTATVAHKGSRSFSQVPAKHAAEMTRGILLFYSRHAPRRVIWLRVGLWAILWTKKILFQGAAIASIQRFRLRKGYCESKLEVLRNTVPKRRLATGASVSVIIPTRNRPCVLDLLERLRDQTFQDFEILVIDQSDPGRWANIDSAGFNGRLRIIRSTITGRSNARNLGIYHARGSLLIFCDDDILPPLEFVGTHVLLHGDGVGGVSLRHTEPGLPYVTTKNMCRITWYGRMIDNYQSDVTAYIETLTGPNMSFTSETQLQTGLFECGLNGTSIFEEQDFSERLRATGHKILFSNLLSFLHLPQTNGNKSLRSIDPAGYYRSFHHNEIFFFLKNRPRIQLVAVIPFCLLRSVKQTMIYKRPLGDAWTMFRGVFDGMSSYYRGL